MADTPRVTVPVEPRERLAQYIKGTSPYRAWRGEAPEGEPTLKGDIAVLLSAAPAPEGVAVKEVTEDDAPAYLSAEAAYGWACGYNASLATREVAPDWTARTEAAWAENNSEEAPAEAEAFIGAGDADKAKGVYGPLSKDFLINLLADRDAEIAALRAQPQARAWGWGYEICTGCSASLSEDDIKASGHVSCCPDRRMVTVRELVDAYEAQRKTQAREDAQPFMWAYQTVTDGEWKAFSKQLERADGSICPGVALYRHPAPDALRVAVEALREVSALRSNGHGDEWESGFTQGTVRAADIADQALATLQAEQKGGA